MQRGTTQVERSAAAVLVAGSWLSSRSLGLRQ